MVPVLTAPVDIRRRRNPVQLLARASKSLSRSAKSSSYLLHSEPVHTTPGTPVSLGHRAEARGRCVEVKNASCDA
jgi:hypothetical protein